MILTVYSLKHFHYLKWFFSHEEIWLAGFMYRVMIASIKKDYSRSGTPNDKPEHGMG